MSEHIDQAHRVSDETYGMPRIRAELADMGMVASRKRIGRLLRADGHSGREPPTRLVRHHRAK